MDSGEFLHELFDTKPADAYINIWTVAGKKKRSNFFKDIDEAAQFVQSIAADPIDIYIGCGFFSSNLGPGRRGTKIDVIGIPGFYMDIDFETEIKKGCPPNIDAARLLIEGYGADPTIIVNSGNGIHPWWLFKECWEFEADEYKKAEEMNKRLQATIKARAAKYGWTLDSTQDVTRVLRIPGTFNYKSPDHPKKVTVALNSGPRYAEADDFDSVTLESAYVDQPQPVSATELKDIAADFKIDYAADPPAKSLDDLLEIDVRFRLTWAHKRNDMSDDSPSGYALSLANVAAEASWSSQEICDLIVAFYRRHNLDITKLHSKKISYTIGKARARMDQSAVNDFIDNVSPIQGTEAEKVIDPTGNRARQAVCKMLNLKIVRLVQYEQEKKSAYIMYLADGRQIPFKNTDQLMEYRRFKMLAFEKTQKNIRLSTKRWQECQNNFEKFITVVKAGPTTAAERMALWIEIFLADKKPISMAESVFDQEPFFHDAHWHIYGKRFYNWAWQNYGQTEGISKTELDFTLIDAERVRYNMPHPDDPNKRKDIRPWKIPQTVAIPPVTGTALGR